MPECNDRYKVYSEEKDNLIHDKLIKLIWRYQHTFDKPYLFSVFVRNYDGDDDYCENCLDINLFNSLSLECRHIKNICLVVKLGGLYRLLIFHKYYDSYYRTNKYDILFINPIVEEDVAECGSYIKKILLRFPEVSNRINSQSQTQHPFVESPFVPPDPYKLQLSASVCYSLCIKFFSSGTINVNELQQLCLDSDEMWRLFNIDNSLDLFQDEIISQVALPPLDEEYYDGLYLCRPMLEPPLEEYDCCCVQ